MQNLSKLFLSMMLFLGSFFLLSCVENSKPTQITDEKFKIKMPNFYYLPDKVEEKYADEKKLDKKVPFKSGDTIPYYEFEKENGDIGVRFTFYVEFPYNQDSQKSRKVFWISSTEDVSNAQTIPYNEMTVMFTECEITRKNIALTGIVYNCEFTAHKGEQIKMPYPYETLNFKETIVKHTLFLAYQNYIGENGEPLPSPLIKFKLKPASN